MFCLFKNSHVRPELNRYLVFAGWIGVLAWLYFAFYEKALIMKLLAGEAILVDLLLGIPLVLMLAVVVYATIYWFLKLLVVYFMPQALLPAEPGQDMAEVEEPTDQESEFGEGYWNGSGSEKDEASQPSDQKTDPKTPSKE